MKSFRSNSRRWQEITRQCAEIISLSGVVTYLILSEAFLERIGYHYTDGQGGSLHKIHPAAFLIIAAFLLSLVAGRKPEGGSHYASERESSWALLSITVAGIVFSMLRSGPQGLGFLLDTHIVIPLIFLVLLEATPSFARRALAVLLGFAILDAAAGIGQWAMTRGAHSPETWSLMGSPIASAVFLPAALFTALELEGRPGTKAGLLFLFSVAIAVLGNVAAILVASLGMLSLALREALHRPARGYRCVPIRARCLFMLLLGGGLAALLCFGRHEALSGLVETQKQAFRVIGHLSLPEVMLGVPSDRITQLASLEGLAIPQSDINDPWVLMFLTLGGGFFFLWLAATAWFLRSLTRHSAFLAWAAMAYFLVATTSNSFGRKDVVYPAVIGLVTCAAQGRIRDGGLGIRQHASVTEPG